MATFNKVIITITIDKIHTKKMFKLKPIFSRILNIEEIQRQSIISFSGQITLTVIGFLGTIYFARTLGAEILGAYFLFMAYYHIISMVTDGGFGGAAVKRISEGEEQDAYFSAAFVLRVLFTATILIVLIMFRSYFVDLNDAGIFVWFLIALGLAILRGPLYNGIAGCGKMGIHATGSYIGDISRTFFQIIAVIFGYGVVGLAGGFVAGIIVATIIALPFFDLRIAHFGWKHIKNLSTFSFWLFLTSSGVLMYSYTDRVIIGYYLTNADVGIYQIAVQFATLASFAAVALRSTLWPKVSRWGKIEENKPIERSLSKAISYALMLAVPVMIGGIFLGNQLLYFLYGPEFSKGYITLILILIAQVINVFQYLFTMYLGALDFQKESFKATAIGATGNIILNLILVPIIGIDGAAFATLVTLTLNAFLAHKYLSKIIKIKIEYSNLLNILIASVIMGIFVLTYRMALTTSNTLMTITAVFLGAILYSIIIIKMDTMVHDDLKEMATQARLPWPNWL